MTNPTMALAELAEKGADVDVLRQMVQFAAQRLMEMAAESLWGAGYDGKNPERINSRNGYRERSWETRAGTVDLGVARLRQGSCCPAFLEPRRTAEKALAAVIQEAYVCGVSTRLVDDLVEAMGMSGASKSLGHGCAPRSSAEPTWWASSPTTRPSRATPLRGTRPLPQVGCAECGGGRTTPCAPHLPPRRLCAARLRMLYRAFRAPAVDSLRPLPP